MSESAGAEKKRYYDCKIEAVGPVQIPLPPGTALSRQINTSESPRQEKRTNNLPKANLDTGADALRQTFDNFLLEKSKCKLD